MVWGAPRGVDDLVAKLKENKTVRSKGKQTFLADGTVMLSLKPETTIFINKYVYRALSSHM